jgi:twitching motility protein PilT
MTMDEQTLQQILSAGAKYGASDIHFKVGMAPLLRVSKGLSWIKAPKLSSEDMEKIVSFLLSNVTHEVDRNASELDFSYAIPDLCRFRVNIFKQMGNHSVIMRIIPTKIPTFDDLNVPVGIRKVADFDRGLVLVAGATGSGKTSTLAAIVDHINKKRNCHILTIEDPIEFVHTDNKCSITQRELGLDTPTFTQALRSSLRQDPDVLLVGEMRDYETIDMALKAAETGHLVLSTIHTTDTVKSINRLMSVFPSNEQEAIRYRLAETLSAIIVQRLLPTPDRKAMVAVCEIMINSLSIKDCIQNKEKLSLINDFIAKGRDVSGTQTFDQHLAELYKDEKISLDVAKSAASNPGDFERSLHFE